MTVHSYIKQELPLQDFQIKNTLQLFAEGATIPFIARYRKEMTGELDEVLIGEIQKLNQQFTDIEKRKAYILSVIEEKQLLTDDLRRKISDCFDVQQLEDLYLPYKSKKQSKADVARKKGLEPLAKMIMKADYGTPEGLAAKFVKGEVNSVDEALEGARFIMAEWINESTHNRNYIRRAIQRQAELKSKLVKKKEAEAEKYKDYFDWEENFSRMASHRFLAIMRASKEGCVKVKLDFPDSSVYDGLVDRVSKYKNASFVDCISLAIKDAYKRLLFPSLENEALQLAKERADKEAIIVFAGNVQQLLMEAPLGQKRVLAIDPGFRTGCKVVCLSENGDLLTNTTIFPHDKSKAELAQKKIADLVKQYRIEAIAIGNGTAGRETENFVKALGLSKDLLILSVNESGASIYSASAVAREEFPDHDITVRGAVSIGRRVMDPLAELVKIEPKSIGVGQYQHDVDQKALNLSLDAVVSNCVNKVGVELNTASKELLKHVAGLGEGLAKNIVEYRKANGPFKNRKSLNKVPRLGAKAYEQCAGFLRIRNGDNLLDNSSVHPERYALVKKMAADLNLNLEKFLGDGESRRKIKAEAYVSESAGLPTITDILAELDKPGRDPRAEFKQFEFSEGVNEITDLWEGMELNGMVSNITSFGCFVDIGVHQDGLVHVSELANKFVKDPNEVVTLKQKVRAKVLSVDVQRKRIGLSLKQASQEAL